MQIAPQDRESLVYVSTFRYCWDGPGPQPLPVGRGHRHS